MLIKIAVVYLTILPAWYHKIFLFLVQQNLNQERQNRFRNGSYSQNQDSAYSRAEETVLDEDKPTSIDVAIAATRDLHMHQARGYGAYALRSVMLIRYSQKVILFSLVI